MPRTLLGAPRILRGPIVANQASCFAIAFICVSPIGTFRDAARVIGDDPSEDDNKHDDFITTQPSAKLFQRFVLKPDRVGNVHASNGAPASGVRGRLAKAMQAGTNKVRVIETSCGAVSPHK